MKKKILLLLTVLATVQPSAFSQDGLLIDYEGNTARDASAIIQLNSDQTANQGFLAPRVALTNTTLAAPIYLNAPATGLLIYNTAAVADVTPGFYYWDGSWKRFATGTGSSLFSSGTGLSWNANTLNSVWTASGNDIYNNNSGSVGIGMTVPNYKLVVSGAIGIDRLGTGAIGYMQWERSATNDRLWSFVNSSSSPAGGWDFFSSDPSYNTSVMRIQNNGRVGIGITGPATIFHVDDNAAAGTGLTVTGGGSGSPMATFTRDIGGVGTIQVKSSGNNPQITFDSGANTFAMGVEGSTFKISDNSALGTNDRISILADGKVGVGTSVPTTALEVNGGLWVRHIPVMGRGATAWDSYGYEARISGTGTTPPLIIDQDGTARLVVNQNGNLGIGPTGLPTQKLDVDGQIRMRTGANTGYIPVSSADGTMTWTNPTSITTGVDDWLNNGTHIYKGNAGNVGIGISDPTQLLHVTGNIRKDFSASSGGTSAWLLINNDGAGNWSEYINSTGAGSPTHITEGSAFRRLYSPNTVASASNIFYYMYSNPGAAASGHTWLTYMQMDAVNNNLSLLPSAGNVGIGVTTPKSKLYVFGANSTASLSSSTGSIATFESNTSVQLQIGAISGGSYASWIQSKVDGQNAAYPLTLQPAGGNIGISTTVPASKLDVLGAASTASLSSSAGSIATFTSSTAVQLQIGALSGGSYASWIQSKVDGQNLAYPIALQPAGGNVGIGSTTPQASLDVAGSTTKFSNGYPVYRWFHGGGQDLNWKTIANVTLPGGSYQGVSFRVDIIDPNTNFGSTATAAPAHFYVSMVRSGAVQDDANTAYVSGPFNEYVRVVKTSTGVYELQVRQCADWRHFMVEAEVVSMCCGAIAVNYVTSPVNGSTSGTIYTATPTHIENFAQMRVGGLSGTGSRTVYADASGTLTTSTTTLQDWRLVYRDEFETGTDGWVGNTATTNSTAGTFGRTQMGAGSVSSGNWILTNYVTSGTPNIVLKKGYDLTSIPHTEVMVKLTYYFIDSWDNETGWVGISSAQTTRPDMIWSDHWDFDGYVGDVFSYSVGSASFRDKQDYVTGQVKNSSNTIWVHVSSNGLGAVLTDEAFGIDNVEIYVR